jgi:acyl-CoA thioesterase FadM
VQIRYEGSVQGKPVFRARNTGVIVDMKTFKPTAIPAWLRERLQAAMETPAARPTS